MKRKDIPDTDREIINKLVKVFLGETITFTDEQIACMEERMNLEYLVELAFRQARCTESNGKQMAPNINCAMHILNDKRMAELVNEYRKQLTDVQNAFLDDRRIRKLVRSELSKELSIMVAKEMRDED